jgi:hypothetical protein
LFGFRNELTVVDKIIEKLAQTAKEGRRDCDTTMASEGKRHEPACMIAHNLISKLAAIVGRCDLLNEGTKQSDETAKHIAAITHKCAMSLSLHARE